MVVLVQEVGYNLTRGSGGGQKIKQEVSSSFGTRELWWSEIKRSAIT